MANGFDTTVQVTKPPSKVLLAVMLLLLLLLLRADGKMGTIPWNVKFTVTGPKVFPSGAEGREAQEEEEAVLPVQGEVVVGSLCTAFSKGVVLGVQETLTASPNEGEMGKVRDKVEETKGQLENSVVVVAVVEEAFEREAKLMGMIDEEDEEEGLLEVEPPLLDWVILGGKRAVEGVLQG